MGRSPHCGQPHPHPSLVHTNQFRARASLRIADNHDGTHHWRTPIKSPGRNHPAGRDRSTRGHIGCGASSNDDVYCGTKVEYRTSSTPAYTDGLDLHYSTNNPPTKAWAPPKPALRTTRAGPIIGAHPRKPGVQLRIADNCACTNRRCLPTDHVAGGLVKLTPAVFPPGQTAAENGWTVNVYESRPHETPHCGQLLVYQLWGRPTKPRFRTRPTLRTTPGVPTMGNTHKALYR